MQASQGALATIIVFNAPHKQVSSNDARSCFTCNTSLQCKPHRQPRVFLAKWSQYGKSMKMYIFTFPIEYVRRIFQSVFFVFPIMLYNVILNALSLALLAMRNWGQTR